MVRMSQIGEGAKAAFAVVDPDAVGGLEIVADVNVGRAIAVEVVEGDSKVQVAGRFLKRLAGLGQKGAVGPRDGGEMGLAVVAVESRQGTGLDQQAVHDLDSQGGATHHPGSAVDHAHGDRAAAAEDRVVAVVGHKQVQGAIAVNVSQGQALAARVVQQQAGLLGDIFEAAVAVVEQTGIGPEQGGDQQVEPAVGVEVGEGGAA